MSFNVIEHLPPDKNILESMESYISGSVIGWIPESVSIPMGNGPVVFRGHAVVTGSIVLDWWDVYARSRRLIKDSKITPDSVMFGAFEESMRKQGKTMGSSIDYHKMRSIIAQQINTDEESRIRQLLTEKEKKFLYRNALYLHEKSSSYFPEEDIVSI